MIELFFLVDFGWYCDGWQKMAGHHAFKEGKGLIFIGLKEVKVEVACDEYLLLFVA